MSTKIVSVAAASLLMLGGIAFAEPDQAGAYRPASPSEPVRQEVLRDTGVDVDMMPTASIGAGAAVSVPAGPDCGLSSREGGGEPSSVDPTSPSVANC